MHIFQKGYINFLSGGMFSGKTEALFGALRRFDIRHNIILFKPLMDQRYFKRKAASHNGSSFPSRNVVSTVDIDQWLESHQVDVIGIDEAQFLKADQMSLVDLAQKWADKGKVLIITALDKDFQGLPFPGIPELWVVAEKSEKFNAICVGEGCKSLAAYSHRIVSGGDQILVGGKESYQPLCRDCFNQMTAKRA